jgi:DNA-binding transcriptional regulator LsrR (DeoR family)
MTSWNDLQLDKLSNISNHKVVPDIAGEFNWMHNINGKWELHSIKVFEQENVAYSWMYFWLDKYNKELTDRRATQARRSKRRMKAIRRSVTMTNKEKALEIRTLMTSWTQQEIANELSIGKRTVERYLAV